jgi:hypothetical protein
MSDGISHPHEKRPIRWWFGERQDRSGWVTESVATNLTRTIDRYAKNREGKTVRAQDDELIHVHHGYRPLLDGYKTARKEFFFRGARVCR